jgi:hypothetical protein
VDSAGDLTEDYMSVGVLAPEHVTPSDLHGVIGTGLFNFNKPVDDRDSKAVSLLFVIIT